MKHCLFCKRSLQGNKAKEHAIPKWLLEYIDLHSITCAEILNTSTGYRANQRIAIGTNSLQVGTICKNCNNGWMSALESTCKPLIIGLMEGKIAVNNLTADQKKLISKWAIKTSYVLNHTWKISPIVPSKHFEQLATSSVSSLPFRNVDRLLT